MSSKPDPKTGRVAYDDRGQHVGFDPYSTATAHEQPRTPRRTLDDMRKLSEEIKRNRQRK
jgi:hypothetical protein